MDFDKTNTAIAFIDDGLFCIKGVEEKGRHPILKINVNVDGVDKEISLWFSTDKNTGEYRLTSNGSKMLTGKVQAPYRADAQSAPVKETPSFADNIPF
ncbi:hypothetical protein HN803_08625 [candidate division WWE3 bacterium]|nr:hypothetical protein [candidate division WWE3 bacterium]